MTGVASGTLLAVFAHPDDETFLAGPLLAHLAARGVAVHLLCATPEAGGEHTIAGIRRAELQQAAHVLGLRKVRHLGYSEAKLGQATVADIAARVQAIAHQLRADAILTDAAYGAYGHPHHILLHRAAVATGLALAQAGHPVPVYTLAYPLPLVKLYFRLAGALGLLARLTQGREDINLSDILREVRPADLALDVRGTVATRKQAGTMHRSQLAGAPPPLRWLEASPVWAQSLLFGKARLTRVVSGSSDPPWLR